MKASPTLRTHAWLLRGLGGVHGILEYEDGKVRYTTDGTGTLWDFQMRKLEKDLRMGGLFRRMRDGKTALLFDWPKEEIRQEFPWYYFGGGLVLRSRKFRLKFSLIRPNWDWTDTGDAPVRFADLRAIRNAARQWKEILEP